MRDRQFVPGTLMQNGRLGDAWLSAFHVCLTKKKKMSCCSQPLHPSPAQVCSIWKKHRLTILAAARVTTSGAGEECANASAVKEGGGGGPGRRRGVGPGQGRKGGRLNAIHYHSTKDAQVRGVFWAGAGHMGYSLYVRTARTV